MDEDQLVGMNNLRVFMAWMLVFFHITFFLYLYHAANFGFISYDINQIYFPRLPKDIYSVVFFFSTYVPFFMTLFFLISGFFANRVFQQKGVVYFVKNRFIRVMIPFCFFLFFYVLIYFLNVVIPLMYQKKESFLSVISDQYHSGMLFYALNKTSSYWFLDVLLWCSLVAILYMAVRKSGWISNSFFTALSTINQKIFLSWIGFVVIPLYITGLLLHGHYWFLLLNEGIFPGFSILLFYLCWFFIGWNFCNHPDFLIKLQKKSVILIILSCVFYVMHSFIYIYFFESSNGVAYFSSCFLFSCAVTFQSIGFLAFFINYCQFKRAYLMYLTKGAYWLYLIQIPLIYFLAGACMVFLRSYIAQFFVCLIIFSIIYFLSFHFLIKKTRLDRIVA